jgi:hypothetical protein
MPSDSASPDPNNSSVSSTSPEATEILPPLSPELPAIETPFGSPLTKLPDLPDSSPPSPSPPQSPPCALFEPKFGKNGLIISEPNTGCGHRQRAQQDKPPWNYHGTWKAPETTPKETPPSPHIESEDEDVTRPTETSPHLSNEKILAGMSFVDCGEDPEG